MITIFEGPDGAGKTTVAQHYAGITGAEYVHCGPPKGDPFREYFELFRSTDVLRGRVFDRYHLGERVYGPVYRDHDGLGAARQRMLERALFTQRAVVVKALPPFNVVLKNWTTRKGEGKEMLDNTGQLKAVYEGFQRIRTALPSFYFDYTIDSVYDLKQWIEDSRPGANLGPGAGNFSEGNTLLVGEQCGPKDITGLPFIGDAGSCSLWLADQLEQWGVPEFALYWINALDPQGNTEHPGFIDQLRPACVIALGKIATQWCEVHDIAHVAVPHPQYWKRFKSHSPYPLRDLLG